ncbi:hypothetical protein EDC01DRAFT_626498 [Geopyxis carbonaria]|nr:hypothetical protein EDC01DRAFT_626498 [Geopyxis carbonaria]
MSSDISTDSGVAIIASGLDHTIIDPTGDFIIHAPTHTYLCSSAVLKAASKRFTSEDHHLFISPLPLNTASAADTNTAITLILEILHGTYRPAPPGTPPPTVGVLAAFGTFSMRYHVTTQTAMFAHAWTQQHRFKSAIDWAVWAHLARVFLRPSAFANAARTGVIAANESDLHAYTSFLGRDVVSVLQAHRIKLLGAVISDTNVFLKQRAHTTRPQSLHRLCLDDDHGCEAAILGGILLGLTDAQLFPTPGAPYKMLRVNEILLALEQMVVVGPVGAHKDCREAVEVMWAGLIKGIRSRVWTYPVDWKWGGVPKERKQARLRAGTEEAMRQEQQRYVEPVRPMARRASTFPTPAEAARLGMWDRK